MATTTNYGWDTPDDTDLVKDGAAAIRTLGSSVDTTTKNLNPQTTTGAIAYRSATANVNTALPIGTAGQVLKVNSGATAPEWGTAAAGGFTKITSATFSAVSSVSFANSTFTSTYKDYYITFELTATSADLIVQGRLRASGSDNTTTNYGNFVELLASNNTASTIAEMSVDKWTLGYAPATIGNFSGVYHFISPQASQTTKISGQGMGVRSNYEFYAGRNANHYFNATTSFDSFSFIASTGNFTGRYAVYGLEA